MLLRFLPMRYSRRRWLRPKRRPPAPPPPPPSTDTLVTSVQKVGPSTFRWNFDHPVTQPVATDTVVRVDGQAPMQFDSWGGTWIQYIYFVDPDPGVGWELTNTPNFFSSPGRVIPAPQSGTVE